MSRIARMMFVLLVIIGPVLIVGTSGVLPETVATHFGTGNAANGWMSHRGYILFMVLMTTLLPLTIVGITTGLVRAGSANLSLPNGEYWLAPSRRQATLARLSTRFYWLACLLILFLLGVHGTIIAANYGNPAVLPGGAFWTLLAVFLTLMAIWVATFLTEFRLPR